MLIASGALHAVCWLPWAVVSTIAWAAAWVVLSLGPAHAFDPARTLRFSRHELGLYKGEPLPLVALPGGRPGLLRRPCICIGADGRLGVQPHQASVVIRPGPNGTLRLWVRSLEQRRRPGMPWSRTESSELAHGPVPGVNYRAGGLYLRFD